MLNFFSVHHTKIIFKELHSTIQMFWVSDIFYFFIHQGCIKLMKSNGKDVNYVKKNILIKCLLFELCSSKNSGKKSHYTKAVNIRNYKKRLQIRMTVERIM